MKHYVPDLKTYSLNKGGIETADFCKQQRTACGKTIEVNSRNEFATKINGLSEVDCPDCLKWIKNIVYAPSKCDQCSCTMQIEDYIELKPTDTEFLCKMCRSNPFKRN